MRLLDGLKQPFNVVRACVAFFRFYSAVSRLGLALVALAGTSGHAAVLETRDPIGWKHSHSGYEVTYGSASEALTTACFFESGRIAASFQQALAPPYSGQNMSIPSRRCKIERYGTYAIETVYANISAVAVCAESGQAFLPYGSDYYASTKCDVPTCPSSSSTCLLSSTSPISSVPGSACVESCQIVQGITATQDRFIGGVHTWYYTISKAATGVRCSATGGAAGLVSCNATEIPAQDPCSLPDAATNTACNGGGGCPAGQTVLANGACTPNNSNAPCVAPSYRDSTGACVPFAGAGSGSGTGGAGTAGAGGNSGSTGGAGGSGGAGSSTGGGGGGGSGGQGGGGGGAGSGGAGGTGGSAGKNAECGPGKMLCEETFADYAAKVKEFFAGDPAVVADAKAEIAKSAGGGYDENPMTKGPKVDLASLHLDTGGGMIGGSHACPAPRSVSFKNSSFALSFQPLCDFSGYIRGVLLAMCALVSARMVFGAWS